MFTTAARWALGLIISVGLGQIVTKAFLDWLRKSSDLGEKPGDQPSPKRLPSWILGATERSAFTIFVAATPSAAVAPMIGWLALKLATNWNHPSWKTHPDIRTWAMTALLAGLVSMVFAFVGGLVASGRLYVGI